VKLTFITEFDRKNLNFRPCGTKFDEKTDYISAGYETIFRDSEPGIPAVQTGRRRYGERPKSLALASGNRRWWNGKAVPATEAEG
jgi:hypothetical protein